MRANELQRRIAALPGPLYRRVEVAAALGVSPTAISELYTRRPEMTPSARIELYGQSIYLFSDADVEKYRQHFARDGAKPGRPRIWSIAEARERERARQRARSLDARAESARAGGDEARAEVLLAEAERLRAKLARARASRVAEMPQRSLSQRQLERQSQDRELRRLREIEREFRTTIVVLAVLVERLLTRPGAMVVVTDPELADPPDLIAHRSDQRAAVFLRTER